MIIKINVNESGSPAGKLADAELHFTDGPLAGLKLIGFSVWQSRSAGRNVTFPARQYSINGERRSFAFAPADRRRRRTIARPSDDPGSIRCRDRRVAIPAGNSAGLQWEITIMYYVLKSGDQYLSLNGLTDRQFDAIRFNTKPVIGAGDLEDVRPVKVRQSSDVRPCQDCADCSPNS